MGDLAGLAVGLPARRLQPQLPRRRRAARQERFGISAAQLSFFVVLQLVVYAGLQIPIGVLLDRYGSRALLLAGLVLMAVGQLVFAFADVVPGGRRSRAPCSVPATPRSSSA